MSDADPDLPAYALGAAGRDALPPVPWAFGGVDADWAWGGSTGAGVKVAIVDSGIDRDHPRVGGNVTRLVCPQPVEDGDPVMVDDEAGDLSGHGTACAGIVRGLAPDCELWSVRVLGGDISGTGPDLLAGLRWAIESGAQVINMSLSTRKRKFLDAFYELADDAYFRRSMLVCSAHNLPVDSWPWKMSSVVSVAGHAGTDPFELYANTRQPPVEFYAPGVDLEIAWSGGTTIRASGNSFAAPHVAGLCALILAKHPDLAPYALKDVLVQASRNASGVAA